MVVHPDHHDGIHRGRNSRLVSLQNHLEEGLFAFLLPVLLNKTYPTQFFPRHWAFSIVQDCFRDARFAGLETQPNQNFSYIIYDKVLVLPILAMLSLWP